MVVKFMLVFFNRELFDNALFFNYLTCFSCVMNNHVIKVVSVKWFAAGFVTK